MTTKRYFISHAGADKPLALELKAALGDDAWVDLHEIDVGQLLLHEISAGIEASTDFVLLWSRASSESRWVQFETTMAFTRWLEDSAIALRIVCLDSTPVPLHFRPFLQARTTTTPAEIASLLGGTPQPHDLEEDSSIGIPKSTALRKHSTTAPFRHCGSAEFRGAGSAPWPARDLRE
ncbi:toll/interleukin-1 receptor domain-containing protein [Micrococcus endophyticus]|nr:toll/interleukin-1 receptor domain-containing protein [Micrococcus endophyticus]